MVSGDELIKDGEWHARESRLEEDYRIKEMFKWAYKYSVVELGFYIEFKEFRSKNINLAGMFIGEEIARDLRNFEGFIRSLRRSAIHSINDMVPSSVRYFREEEL